MYLLINSLYLVAGIIWGDWRNWRNYYPTILFFIIGDFLYNFLLYNKPMWIFHDFVLPNHTSITLLSMIVSYSSTVMIYLGKFPKSWINRFLWFLLWTAIYSIIEYLNSIFGFITYHNGWNFWWSVLFTAIIFFILPIHHKNPLYAWLVSLFIIIILLSTFDVNIIKMK